MGRAISLESFDILEVSEHPPQEPIPPELGYEDGYATGREGGLAEARAEAARLEDDLVQAFTELSFTHAEARNHVLQALGPLFTSIMETLLPEAARASLVPYIVETLMEAAEQDSRMPLALLVSPQAVEPVRAVAEGRAGNPVVIDANPGLGPGEVLIRQADRETMLDLDRLLTDIQGAMQALFIDEPGRQTHG